MRELNITEIQHISGGADVLEHIRSLKEGLTPKEITIATLTGSFAFVGGTFLKNKVVAGGLAAVVLGGWYLYNALNASSVGSIRSADKTEL